MDDTEIERKRAANLTRIVGRGLNACAQENAAGDVELNMLLTGPHARIVALGILGSPSASAQAVARGARLWAPFGEKANLLYELVADRSEIGIQRVKNLLDAGWDPNLKIEGSNRTAIMQVTNSWSPSTRAMVSLLIAAGADVGSESVSGQTALDYAPTTMRNYIRAFIEEVKQDTTNRSRPKRANGTR